ncbi:MAG: DUF6311 domain-containing protein [Oscillospiraceae bacterium]|nr:DUF6311 domain-containing protein [Oscillospiraceae bacterium]
MKMKSRQWILPLMGMLFGILIFCIVFGVRIINPTYDTWMTTGDDSTQHYLGWLYYRQTPWTFPIGMIDGLSCDGAFSCIYMDTIPLFAVFFKLLSPILPETFQYFGIWGVFSFGMMGLFSTILLQKYSKNALFCLSGALCFILSPSLLRRLYGHESLAGQWVIVMAIALWVYQNRKWKHWFTPSLLWAGVAVIAVSVHMYFVPMVFLVMMGALLDALIRTKSWKYVLFTGILSVVATLLWMFILGAFVGVGSYAVSGFGVFSSNLLSLFFPGDIGCISFFPIQVREEQTFEGYAYLGFGIIAGGFVTAVHLLMTLSNRGKGALRKWASAHISLLIGGSVTFVATAVWALSHIVALGTHVLYTIPLPHLFVSALGIFRASGRLMWVNVYLIYLGVFYGMSKLNVKKVLPPMFAAFFCAIQMWDVHGDLLVKHLCYDQYSNYTLPLQDPLWETAAEGTDEIIFAPLPLDFLAYSELYLPLGFFALEHDMTLSSFYAARCNYDTLAAYADSAYNALCDGKGRTDALYVFFNEEDIPQSDHLTVYVLDGFYTARFHE